MERALSGRVFLFHAKLEENTGGFAHKQKELFYVSA